MKRLIWTTLTTAVLAAVATLPGFAYDNEQAGISLHIASVTTKNACTPSGLTINTFKVWEPQLSTAEGPFFFTYLLVCDGSDSTGIAGMEMGIDYQGALAPEGGAFPISVFSWHLCGDLEWNLGDWPAPGTGNMITWDRINNCQDQPTASWRNTVIAIGGYFYMAAYGPATMNVTPRPVSGRAKVADCRPYPAETDLTDMWPSHLGIAAWGAGQYGYSYCGDVIIPVESTTWGRLKTLHR